MTNPSKPRVLREMRLGAKVERAAATLPQSATGALFNVSGGRVAVTQIVGEVTTVFGAVATNAKLISTPTVGTASDMCAVLAIASKEVGTLFGITGLNSDVLIGINAGLLPAQTRDVVVNTGTIGLNTNANNTGAAKWTIFYVPIDEGAAVTAT